MQFIETMYGGLTSLHPLGVTLSVVMVLLVLGYTGVSLWLWALAAAATLPVKRVLEEPVLAN